MSDGLLSERMRPTAQAPQALVGPAARLWLGPLRAWREGAHFPLVLWGPPGTGKTTLARMLGQSTGQKVHTLSAVQDGVKEIRDVVQKWPGDILFLDEIHRLTRTQQDVLLPVLEQSLVSFVGATTEFPGGCLSPALLSRLRTFHVKAPTATDLAQVLAKGLERLQVEGLQFTPEREAELLERCQGVLPRVAQGDVRMALNLLETLCHTENAEEEKALLENLSRAWTDKTHYDLASAMIKSIRGSDPDAALYYAVAAVDSGEDPRFLLRRVIIAASEDVGNADPTALAVAVNALKAVECVGMPEGLIPLAQAVTWCASAPKSNRSYRALKVVRQWREEAEERFGKGAGALAPPRHLTLAGAPDYVYPHDAPQAFVATEYLPEAIALIRREKGPAYDPSDRGAEARVLERLQKLWG